MKKRLKTVEIRKGKEEFKDCLSNWEDVDTDKNKLTTPINVPSHYKTYTMAERKIVVKKPERRDTPGMSYNGPKSAKKVDLAS